MRATNPVTIQRHVLPGEERGDTAWFQRQNRFEQREVLRQVAFKRCRWPDLPDGHSSKHPTYTYPHILPAGYEGMAFYGPLADDILSYLVVNDIIPHSELLNLKSSQAAYMDFLFPLRGITMNAASSGTTFGGNPTKASDEYKAVPAPEH